MKRRYKLLLIIFVGAILTIIINSTSVNSKISLVSLGDGFSLGMTPYSVAGTSFNDYFKEKIEKRHKLDTFNNEFSKEHLTIKELNDYMEQNTLGSFTRVPIKQTLASAEIITIAIGLDEMADKSLVQNITEEQINNYIKEMDILLRTIREFYEKEISVIGLYPAYNFNKKDAIEINSRLQKICGKYNASFIDILALSINEKYYLEKNSYYMNYQAHNEIAKMLYQMYKKIL